MIKEIIDAVKRIREEKARKEMQRSMGRRSGGGWDRANK